MAYNRLLTLPSSAVHTDVCTLSGRYSHPYFGQYFYLVCRYLEKSQKCLIKLVGVPTAGGELFYWHLNLVMLLPVGHGIVGQWSCVQASQWYEHVGGCVPHGV